MSHDVYSYKVAQLRWDPTFRGWYGRYVDSSEASPALSLQTILNVLVEIRGRLSSLSIHDGEMTIVIEMTVTPEKAS